MFVDFGVPLVEKYSNTALFDRDLTFLVLGLFKHAVRNP